MRANRSALSSNSDFALPRIVLHLKARDLDVDLRGPHLALYRHIRELAAKEGIGLHIKQRDADIRIGTRVVTDHRFDDGNLHIIDDRSLRASNVLNAAVAYFRGFWHLDPIGTRAFSGIGQKVYSPDAVTYRAAKPFFDVLRRHHLHGRQSKLPQMESVTQVPNGAIAVFFQGSHPRIAGTTEFTDLEMLKAVLNGVTHRPVVVKLHPAAEQSYESEEVLNLASRNPRLILTDANVHDILKQAVITVSINSTLALEGFIHRKPAVLFGQADFHHFAGRVRYPDEFAKVFSQELQRDGGYAQYLSWYFQKNCLHLTSDTLEDEIWSIFESVGFPKARFKS